MEKAGQVGRVEQGAGRHSTVLVEVDHHPVWSPAVLTNSSAWFVKTMATFFTSTLLVEIHTNTVLMVPSDDAQWTVQNGFIPCASWWAEIHITLDSFNIWKWWHVIDVVPAGHANSWHISPASRGGLCYSSCPPPLSELGINERIDVPSSVDLAPREIMCSAEGGGRQNSHDSTPQYTWAQNRLQLNFGYGCKGQLC